jgi:hypothetical protein
MSHPIGQTGSASVKKSVQSPLPANKPAPVPLDPSLLRHVSGGSSPNGRW